MNDCRKSDKFVVPGKLSNKPNNKGAERVEGRRPVEGKASSDARPGLRAGPACH